MEEVKSKIVDYLEEELSINEKALANYETTDPVKSKALEEAPAEIKKMREIEAIRLRHSIHELRRHIAVIKKMIV